MQPGHRLHRYTYAEYVALEASSPTKHEFFDGEIYAMAGGSEDHSALAAEVLRALGNAIGDRPCRAHTSDLRIYVEAVGLATFPDGAVICGPLAQHPPSPRATATNPLVLLEVTSDSSAEYDTGGKLDAYRTIPSLRDYVVGGLSLGGGMSIGHLLERPGQARGALLLGSYGLMDHQFEGPFTLPLHLLTWAMLRSGLLRRLTWAYARDPRKMESGLRGIIRNPAERTPELLDAVMAEAQRPGAGVAFEQWQFDQFGWRKARTNYTDQLGAITAPVLMVHGERDTGVPVRRAREAAALLPDARLLVVPDAGHWVQRDQPAVVTTAVLDFLAALA